MAQTEAARLIDVAVQHLDRAQGIVLTTCFSPPMEGRSPDIAVKLGQVTRRILERHTVQGLFLTGGDIALQVCLSLDAEALRPVSEVRPGLPVSLLVGGPWGDLPVITKAGGFGASDAIVVGYHHLEKATGSENER